MANPKKKGKNSNNKSSKHSNKNLKKIEKIIEKPTSIFRIIGKTIRPDYEGPTIGQRAADFIAKWAGSWLFITLFFIFLGIWMSTNGYFLLKFINNGTLTDNYPFILLNLALSCLAAIQAPVILMSQNRSSERDRLRAEYDYKVNRKAEREIQELRKQLNRIEEKIK